MTERTKAEISACIPDPQYSIQALSLQWGRWGYSSQLGDNSSYSLQLNAVNHFHVRIFTLKTTISIPPCCCESSSHFVYNALELFIHDWRSTRERPTGFRGRQTGPPKTKAIQRHDRQPAKQAYSDVSITSVNRAWSRPYQ